MEFGGGEFTLHDEFEQIFRYLLDSGFHRYKVYTSCLKYSPELAEALGYGKCEVIISADAGDRETFKKVKQADTYDRFWGNLKKYVDAQKGNYTQVKSKFIILRNINDKKEQINSFLEKSKEIGIKKVIFDIECHDIQNFLTTKNEEMKKYLQDIINYAKYQAENVYGLEFEGFSYVQLFENVCSK
jgi:MoaA/NifB/PqqE/SkfB family radical SAM enzyme